MTSAAAGATWHVDLGNWSTATNWLLGEPTSFVDANIDNAGTAQIDQALEACDNLYLGYGLTDSGNLSITGGDLSVGYDANVGFAGSGSVVQTGGINAIANYLVLGEDNDAVGTYELGGTGQLSAVREYVGADGLGTFLHTGGTNTVSGSLRVGNDGQGTYELSGDPLTVQLIANREYVGNFGIGTFRQTGGTNSINTSLRIGYEAESQGTYELSGGGQLTVNGVVVGNQGTGTFTQSGGTNQLSNGLTIGVEQGADGTYTLSSGQLSTQRQSIGISGIGHFYHTGGSNTSSTKITLAGSSSGQGTYELGGTGQLAALELHVGERSVGTFIHSGGTNSVGEGLNADEFSGLYVGTDALGNGTYQLSGDAALSATYEYVGDKGVGALIQDGGTNTIAQRLYLGRDDSGQGTYQLGGGQLTIERAYIGDLGDGTFTQTGGINTLTGSLRLGESSTGTGTYELSGAGQLDANREYVGYDGTGAFTQTGGDNTISGSLRLGQKATGTGTYELSGSGQLSTNREYVGYSGTGTFTQTGGTNTPDEDLILGYLAGSQGVYEMLGGTLVTGENGYVAVGVEGLSDGAPGGIGRFVMAGGTANAAEFNVGLRGTYQARLSQDFAALVASQVVLDVGSALSLDAIGFVGDLAAGQWGDQSITVLAGTRDGTFTTVPLAGHLGYGVFLTDQGANLQPVTHLADAVVADVLQAAPGDTDGNRKVEGQDILNILQAGLFGDGVTPEAEWGNGDFNGDEKISGEDILALLGTGLFGDGTYTGVSKSIATGGQGDAELVVSADGMVLDSHGAVINGYVLTSKAGILTGQSADNLGLFQADSDSEISGAFAFTLAGSHPLGDVIGREFDAVDLQDDLTLNYTINGIPGLFTANIVVPEPAAMCLLATGLLSLLMFSIRRSPKRCVPH